MPNQSISLHNASILELKKRFLGKHTDISEELLSVLENDSRSGVKSLARTLRNHRQRDLWEEQRLEKLFYFETELRAQGYQKIAGVDEAGVAPLAGPVVAAAVILPHLYHLHGLDDSKKITDASKRETLASKIKENALAWATGQAEVEEIDGMNIYRAGLLAMNRAVHNLQLSPDYALVDARKIPNISCLQKGIIHGDALSASIAAASIIAKTTRDRYMTEMDERYPGYGFASHKGYPTPAHLAALKSLGPLPIHRKSFAPVRVCLGKIPMQNNLFTEGE
jgi:ribonuclease HII